ncbi:acyl--CoA ligase [Planotetraspora sp. A-T 1434]|uniref:class I adenylate-forming enzyme family protein n=1 Tax=Planotetraspora sp. A-T 1434 TaxID=2979219 RepID=UPI0021C24D78|nr:class I adenylate-forming enzyme family protein [Planotetraspora sp. A-T 1434]MCT9935255.1 acyl--CoA ligase [Planotetraspora sp. A-T 1434]
MTRSADADGRVLLGHAAFFDRLRRWAVERPTADAVIAADGTALPYGRLVAAVAATSAHLRDNGARPGEPVAIPTGNSVASIVTILAAAALGAVPLLFDAGATEQERSQLMRLAEARTCVPPVVAREPAAWPEPPAHVQELALVTSGTNGLPKVVGKHWAAVVDNSVRFAEVAGYGDADRILCTTPLHHAFAFGVVLVPALFTGATIVLAPHPPLPSALVPLLAETRATVVQSVPFLYGAALETMPSHGLPDLRLCVSAGEPLRPAVRSAWLEATGARLRDQYGATELGQIGFAAPDGPDDACRLVPGVQARTRLDGEWSAGEGELFVRVPGRPSRYLGQDELTQRSYVDGWFRTGDWGTVDGSGRIVVTGRVNRRVVVGGRKVDPAEVENAVRSMPGVRDCVAVVGEDAGYVAFVVAEPDVTELGLRRHLAALLSSYKIPRRLHLVPALPRTTTGKIRMAPLWQGLTDGSAT